MFTLDQLDEINLLARFRLDSTHEGLKIHSSAPRTVIEAAGRLYKKGFVTQEDGGYLTNRGVHAAEHVHAILSLLSEKNQ